MGREPVADRTVLVTGGAGFIGSHLTDALVDENDVRVLDDVSAGRRERVPDGARLLEGDIRDQDTVDDAMADVDLAFHLAAQVDVERSVEAPVESESVNVGGTLAVLEAARAHDVRVVLASSAAVYGRPDAVPVAEGAAKTPLSPYGLEKLAADHYVRLYHELYGVETVALRFFNTYGPRQGGGPYSGVVDVFARQALDGEPLTIEGDGTQTRDFVFVGDVVRATLLAAGSDLAGEALNVGTGTETSVRALADAMLAATGSDVGVVHTDPRPGDIDRSLADDSKAREAIGFEAEVSLEDGLADLVEWFRSADGE